MSILNEYTLNTNTYILESDNLIQIIFFFKYPFVLLVWPAYKIQTMLIHFSLSYIITKTLYSICWVTYWHSVNAGYVLIFESAW